MKCYLVILITLSIHLLENTLAKKLHFSKTKNKYKSPEVSKALDAFKTKFPSSYEVISKDINPYKIFANFLEEAESKYKLIPAAVCDTNIPTIFLYTAEEPQLYNLVNTYLREFKKQMTNQAYKIDISDNWRVFLESYISDLRTKLQSDYNSREVEPLNFKGKKYIPLYRGGSYFNTEEYFYNSSFISTSLNIFTALKFSKGNTLYIYKVNSGVVGKRLLCSNYLTEEEVLLDIDQYWHVKKVNDDEEGLMREKQAIMEVRANASTTFEKLLNSIERMVYLKIKSKK